MPTYLFNHTKKGDGSKRVFEDSKDDYREEDFFDFDSFPTDFLKYMDDKDYEDLKQSDNNSPFRHRKNVQKI